MDRNRSQEQEEWEPFTEAQAGTGCVLGDAAAGRPCSDVSMGRGAVLSTAGRGESFHCLEH